jgi:hypothetical protein
MTVPLISTSLYNQLMIDVFWEYTGLNMSLCKISLEIERKSMFGIASRRTEPELAEEVMRSSGIALSGEVNVNSRKVVLNIIIDSYGG